MPSSLCANKISKIIIDYLYKKPCNILFYLDWSLLFYLVIFYKKFLENFLTYCTLIWFRFIQSGFHWYVYSFNILVMDLDGEPLLTCCKVFRKYRVQLNIQLYLDYSYSLLFTYVYQKAMILIFNTNFLLQNNLCELKTQTHKFKDLVWQIH